MLMMVLVLGGVCLAIAAGCLIAANNKELADYRDMIVISGMFAIATVCIVGIFAYKPAEAPIASSTTAAAPAQAQAQATTVSTASAVPSQSADKPQTEQTATATAGELEPTLSVTRKVGDTLRDCDICPEMVVVPAGNNNIGEEHGSPGAKTNEYPLAWIRLDQPFAVGRYEITVEQFKEFAKSTNFVPSGPCETDGVGGASASYLNPPFEQAPNHPVICVSFEDAQRYVTWLSKKTGHAYALMSEARWEYVRRSHRVVENKRTEASFEESGNLRGPNWKASTVEVGLFRSNNFLVHDMKGNVGEWTSDCWQENHMVRPKDGSAVVNQGDCQARAVRGGSWDETEEAARPASRRKVLSSERDWRIGFRIIRFLNESNQAKSQNN